MSQTFEELVGASLDALYSGALFLNAGDAQSAERLLIDTMAQAYSDPASRDGDASAWLEGRLAKAFLASTTIPPQQHRRNQSHGALAAPPLTVDALYASATTIPEWARPALWLVLLREWSYSSTTAALDVAPQTLRTMLSYRTHLAASVPSAPPLDQVGGAAG